MRILYIVHQWYPKHYTGTEKFVLNVSSMLQRAGHFVKVGTYDQSQEMIGEQNGNMLSEEYVYNSIPALGIRHTTVPADIHIGLENSDMLRFARELFKRENDYDLVHIGHSMRLAGFAQAAMEAGIPYVMTLTDFWMECPKGTLTTSSQTLCGGPEGGEACSRLCPELEPEWIKARLRLAKDVLSGAHALVSPSRFLASVFKKEFPDLDIQVIPHGMDYQYLVASDKTYQKNDPIVFGFCGSILPHKGVHILIEAFTRLEHSNAKLMLFGSSYGNDEYDARLRRLANGDSRIHFCGSYKAENVGAIMGNFDVMVVPSVWYENYPLAIHEAFACGIPVVASNIGGMAEKVKDFVTGLTFQVGDHNDLKLKLSMIVENPEMLNEIKRTIISPPLIEEEAYMYERLYNDILGRG